MQPDLTLVISEAIGEYVTPNGDIREAAKAVVDHLPKMVQQLSWRKSSHKEKRIWIGS